MIAAVLLVAAYVIGATPTSYAVGRWLHGVDLRTAGSGNLGATNAFRVLGWKAAALVMIVDASKGWIPAALFPLLMPGVTPGWAVAFGAAAIVGHVFSFWVGFRGGKGIATSAGVFLALSPGPLALALLAWVAAMALVRIVSVASLASAVALPVSIRLLHPERGGLLLFSVGLAVFVFWAHRANIARLIRGTEPRIAGPRAQATSPGEEPGWPGGRPLG